LSLNIRIEELKKKFKDALNFIKKGDAIQATGKLYKVAENPKRFYLKLIGFPVCGI